MFTNLHTNFVDVIISRNNFRMIFIEEFWVLWCIKYTLVYFKNSDFTDQFRDQSCHNNTKMIIYTHHINIKDM